MGRKLATFFRQLKHLSMARLKLHINAVHEETGKNRFLIFCDMVWCEVRYGIGYLDYHVFGFAERHGAVRKNVYDRCAEPGADPADERPGVFLSAQRQDRV